MEEHTKSLSKHAVKIPTLGDVAAEAEGRYATADRVINARGNVADKSVRKVHEAMAKL